MKRIALIIIVFGVILWAVAIVGIAIIHKYKGGGKNLYIITNHTFKSEQTFYSDSIVSKTEGCITFKTFGTGEQTVCGNYSITKF